MRQSSFDFGNDVPLHDIRARLLAMFGPQRDEARFDPLSQLVYGILASKTKDEVSMAAFARLRAAGAAPGKSCCAPRLRRSSASSGP